MSQEIEKEDGSKEVVYSTEEYTATENVLKDTQAKLAELEKINATRGDDFKAYSKLSEEEKKAHDANTTNLLKNEEKLRNEISELTTKISDREKREADAVKNHAFSSVHHGDEASKKLIEEKYSLLTGMPESTSEEISARVGAAARLAGIVIDPRNPLYVAINGEAPNYKPNSEYVDTPTGKAALEASRAALGLKTDNK